jgi:hypothetical protein
VTGDHCGDEGTNAITVVVFQLIAATLVLKLEPVTAMAVFSIGEVFIVPSEFAIIDRIAPHDRRGTYFGAQTFTQLGGFVGPYLGVGRRVPGLTHRTRVRDEVRLHQSPS